MSQDIVYLTDAKEAHKRVYSNKNSTLTSNTEGGAIDELDGKIEEANEQIISLNSALANNSNINLRYNEDTDMVEIYYNGKWNEWKLGNMQALYLYNNGDLCIDESGGWNGSYTKSDFSNAVKSESYLSIWSGMGTYSASFVSNKEINFNGRKKLKVKYSNTPEASTAAYPKTTFNIYIGSTIVYTYNCKTSCSGNIAEISLNDYQTIASLKVAVSDGNPYNYGGTGATVLIHEIVLE